MAQSSVLLLTSTCWTGKKEPITALAPCAVSEWVYAGTQNYFRLCVLAGLLLRFGAANMSDKCNIGVTIGSSELC